MLRLFHNKDRLTKFHWGKKIGSGTLKIKLCRAEAGQNAPKSYRYVYSTRIYEYKIGIIVVSAWTNTSNTTQLQPCASRKPGTSTVCIQRKKSIPGKYRCMMRETSKHHLLPALCASTSHDRTAITHIPDIVYIYIGLMCISVFIPAGPAGRTYTRGHAYKPTTKNFLQRQRSCDDLFCFCFWRRFPFPLIIRPSYERFPRPESFFCTSNNNPSTYTVGANACIED